jgi:hypothetical protein
MLVALGARAVCFVKPQSRHYVVVTLYHSKERKGEQQIALILEI